VNLDIKDAIRAAICADMGIVALLGQYEDGPSVHTKKPAPDGAEYPMIIITTPNTFDQDMVNVRLPVVTPDIAVYGENPRHCRVVEEIGYTLHELIHRNRWFLNLSAHGLRMFECTAPGPRLAPTEDETKVGRVLTPTMQLQEI